MGTITKKQLVERVSERSGVSRADTKKVIQDFLDQVISELKRGNRLEFRDFGVFEVKERAARVAQNPKTLQRVPVPAKRTVKFKVGRLMRDSVEKIPTAKPAAAGRTAEKARAADKPQATTTAAAAASNGAAPIAAQVEVKMSDKPVAV
jgi:integration host factor subunit beta